MAQGKHCIPFFQHNWTLQSKSAALGMSEAIVSFLEIPGVEVTALDDGESHLAQAYVDALSRLLPSLNRSQLS
jgi:hypothetical protein